MPLSADQINDLRKRVLNNEPWTYEELAAAVKQVIAERISAFEKPAPKAKPKSVNLDDLI